MRSANCCHVSYIAMEGRTTRGNTCMSLCTGMLKSISFRPIKIPFRLLRRGDPAIQKQGLSRDEIRRRGYEEQYCAEDILRLTDSSHWNTRDQVSIEVRVRQPP